MIGCSFVVDREYFGEIGLLDPGMEVYGAENIELGMRVSTGMTLKLCLPGNETKNNPQLGGTYFVSLVYCGLTELLNF